MDHLPAPADPITPLPEVPYCIDEEDPAYDYGDFLTYPTRLGITQMSTVEQAILFREWERVHPLDDTDIEALLQSWLFFGFLHAVLGKHDLFDADEYVELNTSGVKCVYTRQLNARLRRWVEIVRSWGEERKSEELDHLLACFRLAQQAHYIILAIITRGAIERSCGPLELF